MAASADYTTFTEIIAPMENEDNPNLGGFFTPTSGDDNYAYIFRKTVVHPDRNYFYELGSRRFTGASGSEQPFMMKYFFEADMSIKPVTKLMLPNQSHEHSENVYEFVDLAFMEKDSDYILVLLRGIGYNLDSDNRVLAHSSTIVIDVVDSSYDQVVSWEGLISWENTIARAISCKDTSCIVTYQKEGNHWFKIAYVEYLPTNVEKDVQITKVN